MQQSPSWETNQFSASQEIPTILWNPKVHYHPYKCLPPVPSLSQIIPVHALLPNPTSWRFILILSSHLHLGLPHGLFPSDCLTKTLYVLPFSPIHVTCPIHPILLNFIIQIIIGEEYRSLSSSLFSSQYSPVTYSPQHPILQQPQSTFLPQCEWPSFTPINNERQIYSSLYLNICIIG